MQKIRAFFLQFDMFSAPALFRARGQPQMKSFTVGIFSFVLLGVFTFIFINSSINVINYSNISSVQSQTVIKREDANGYFQTFGIALDFINYQQFEKYFVFETQVFEKGVVTEKIQMVPCRTEQWKLLGQNYESQFKNNQLHTFYCPNTTQPFFLNETYQSLYPTYIRVSLLACSDLVKNPSCNSSLVQEYLQNSSKNQENDGASIIWIYTLDVSVKPQQKIPVTYYVNNEAKVHLTPNFGGGGIIEFATFQILTDVSALPFQVMKEQKGIMIDYIHNYQTYLEDVTTNKLARIIFTLNSKKKTIKRIVGKIDEMLSYAGGLFSIVISFCAIFLMSFNQYRYELMVAEGVFNYDSNGKKILESDLNFLLYIKYTIYQWIEVLLCYQLNWKDCIQIQETRQQVQSHMQVHILFKRIQNLQTAIKHSIDQNQRICINLIEPPSLQNVKKQRLIMQYYDHLLKGNSAITVQDVKIVNDLIVGLSENFLKNLSDTTIKLPIQQSIQSEQINIEITQNKTEERDRERALQIILNNFPEIKKQADEIQLSEQMYQVERLIAIAFYKLSKQVRFVLQQKIPVIILHRLRKQMDQINKESVFNIQL